MGQDRDRASVPEAAVASVAAATVTFPQVSSVPADLLWPFGRELARLSPRTFLLTMTKFPVPVQQIRS